jgi:hypothetical protein
LRLGGVGRPEGANGQTLARVGQAAAMPGMPVTPR